MAHAPRELRPRARSASPRAEPPARAGRGARGGRVERRDLRRPHGDRERSSQFEAPRRGTPRLGRSRPSASPSSPATTTRTPRPTAGVARCRGCSARSRPRARGRPGTLPVESGEMALCCVVDASCYQSIARCGRRASPARRRTRSKRASRTLRSSVEVGRPDPAPPAGGARGALHGWIDGLRGSSRLAEVLSGNHARAHLLHGHLHRSVLIGSSGGAASSARRPWWTSARGRACGSTIWSMGCSWRRERVRSPRHIVSTDVEHLADELRPQLDERRSHRVAEHADVHVVRAEVPASRGSSGKT